MNFLQLLLWIFCNFRSGFSTTYIMDFLQLPFRPHNFFYNLHFIFYNLLFYQNSGFFSTTYQKSAFCKCVYNFKGGVILCYLLGTCNFPTRTGRGQFWDPQAYDYLRKCTQNRFPIGLLCRFRDSRSQSVSHGQTNIDF